MLRSSVPAAIKSKGQAAPVGERSGSLCDAPFAATGWGVSAKKSWTPCRESKTTRFFPKTILIPTPGARRSGADHEAEHSEHLIADGTRSGKTCIGFKNRQPCLPTSSSSADSTDDWHTASHCARSSFQFFLDSHFPYLRPGRIYESISEPLGGPVLPMRRMPVIAWISQGLLS